MSERDPSVFVRLLLHHQGDLLRYILPLVGGLDDAQDVLQETATALWRKFDQFDSRQPFLPWARRFAHNEILMHHRRRQRYTFLTEDLIESLAERQAEQERCRQQLQDALAECMNRLPEGDRLLLSRRYTEQGATVQQLAAEMGRTPNVLYKSLARIRRQLLHCVSRTAPPVTAT